MAYIEDPTDTCICTEMSGRSLKNVNELDEVSMQGELFRCCGSQVWVDNMLRQRPYESVQHLLAVADHFWWSSTEADWRQAFLAHPRIGDVDALKEKYAKNPNAWEGGEQSGADNASEEVLMDLKYSNDVYEDKFGHIFLVCATGKSADEMLDILKRRLANSRAAEIYVAAGEQSKITHLRLAKLLSSYDSIDSKL